MATWKSTMLCRFSVGRKDRDLFNYSNSIIIMFPHIVIKENSEKYKRYIFLKSLTTCILLNAKSDKQKGSPIWNLKFPGLFIYSFM